MSADFSLFAGRPVIDLRSDTLTQPTPAMRQAMAEAEVGDDVFAEDPTVNRLQERVAELLGLEAALFMPSGTMSNQVAIRSHTEPGDEILLDVSAHVSVYEAGAPAALSGVMCQYLPGERGRFTAEHVHAAVRPRNSHFPPTKLVCLENTSNRGGGSVWRLDPVKSVAAAAREHGFKLHLDGARLWNAAVAAGVPERDYASLFDSVSVCFSKGLGAPVGSALAGSREFIQRAHRFRKMFGGGMRQAGVLAAAALHAVEHHRERLAEDHANARRLAEGLATLPAVKLDLATVETNIVIFDVHGVTAADFAAGLEKAGVRLLAIGAQRLRAVTHLHITAADIEETVNRAKAAFSAWKPQMNGDERR
ncbi:MAG: aminotransferase class I/II-fold pyridoxal phosphate-dependent enzyme [Verrucomicrobiales bacterium]|nr:aminotransferase class I/II-fold pyridoxal phosphate-dependent enzyme [Verrucomicrobiales bacterium]